MNGPNTGSLAFSSVIPTEGLAGSSPTTSSQTCIASSEVMYSMNFTAASYFSPSALVVIAFTQ